MSEGAAGFWSYVHADDEGEQGRIVSLAEHLRSQYRLATGGEALDLFVDKDIKWGEEWGARIGNAIAGTTFFIPIITPSYFKSEACRDELLKFVREAERLGLQQLVMPIYWRTVPELEDHPELSLDEAVRTIGRYQWKDFRNARLEDEHLSGFRKAVDDLASELTRRAAQTETVHDASSIIEVASGTGSGEGMTNGRDEGEVSEDETKPGILERLAIGEDALPAILEVAQEVRDQLAEVNRVTEAASQAYSDVHNAKAGLIITERYARELMVPAVRLEELGSQYAAKLAELGAGIDAQLELVGEDTGPLDHKTRAELESLIDLVPVAESLANQLVELVGAAAPLVRMSRSLRAPVRHLRSGLQGIVDGRKAISEWGKGAAEVIERRDKKESPDDRD